MGKDDGVKMRPATPLPWQARDYESKEGGIWIDCNAFANKGKGQCLGGTLATVGPIGTSNPRADADYLVHAANAYPRLVEALKADYEHLRRDAPMRGSRAAIRIDAILELLRSLGELP